MKKLFFTAIALVAFSGVSMAKTGEVEIVKLVNIEKIINTSPTGNCLQEKFNAYNFAISVGDTVDGASSFANTVYYTCMSLSAPKFLFTSPF